MLKTIIFIIFTFQTINAFNKLELPAYNDSAIIIQHSGFILKYDEKYEQANWVAYQLTKKNVLTNVRRTNNFKIDTMIHTGSSTLNDYNNSGYDKGHLFPAADAYNMNSMNDCFYLSNISPQKPSFNRGIWSSLENQVRNWAIKFDTIYVATGGILQDSLKTIGKNVTIPEYFYKAILCLKDSLAIGFILKNEGSKNNLSTFAVSIDSLEKKSGIDFFPLLPDSVEIIIESKIELNKWFK